MSSMGVFGTGGVLDADIASTNAGSGRINDESRHHVEAISGDEKTTEW
tara:strand:- start:6468 stop:6611 length:144 start_codon:yes stop_codon:yes gene_type:complete